MAKKEWLKEGADGLRFGERLEDLIKLRKVTAAAVAKATGVPQSALSGYINQNRAPDCAAIIALAKHFSVSTDYLLGLSKVQTPSTDLQAVVDYTGLSEDNAATLNTHKIAASFDPPLIYNESRNIRGDELFLDCANDLLDALYENRDILLANYYLTKALAASITQCDPAYYDEARERELLSHGYTMMLTVKAVQLSCTEFGDVLGRYLRSKYVDAYYNERTAPTQEGD